MAEKVKEVVEKVILKPKKMDKETERLVKVAHEVIDYQTAELRRTLASVDAVEDENRRTIQLGKVAPHLLKQIEIIKTYKEVLDHL